MKRTLCIAIEIEVSDLPKEARADMAASEGTALTELPSLKDATLDDMREIVQAAIIGNEEAFGGSMVYAAFTDAKVISSLWKEPTKRKASALLD